MKICKVLYGIAFTGLQSYFTNFAFAATCDFSLTSPLLLPHSYAGQTIKRKPLNELVESAKLSNGSRIEIKQSACVDVLTTEYALIVPNKQGTSEDQSALIELLRQTIPNLKTRPSALSLTELNDFLTHAKDVPLRDGTRSVCRDGSTALSGECSWESTGGYVLSIKPIAGSTKISVIQYVSG